MKSVRNEEGYTIVSVIVAFAILLMAIAMFFTVMTFSMKTIDIAADLRLRTEKTMEIFYTNNGSSEEVRKSLTLVPTDSSGGSEILIQAKCGTYQTGLQELSYFVAGEGGIGYKKAKNIMENGFDSGDFERLYNPLGNLQPSVVYTGNNYNEYITNQNGGEFPPISESERLAAQKALDALYDGKVKLPDTLLWKANVTSELGNRGYYLIANSSGAADNTNWRASLLYIGGNLYVNVRRHQYNGSFDPIDTAFFKGYTADEIKNAIDYGTGPENLVSKVKDVFVKVS